ncbi:NmrA family NAD(P)-binding protein [Mucilaginibacter sp. 21P]|uniref:NmrA family NAD(P)-binding protein n=1 Tax=Mucilaginibacter sp. 21P TaxID=2778902 RepID=UPI001C59FD61|nr:NmrA family NAD(P)-binding protein [Mucilaginibacter sp. 21P]QXV63748.1 NmrA family NAD(P)-binding protein [Mucilaginibacter sp. 21P]
MSNIILIAGATGDLGGRLSKHLIGKGAQVRALVREESDPVKVGNLRQSGVEVIPLCFADESGLIAACQGVSCVVSVLAGLREAIVTAQQQLLDAAVKAGVPRFIPSDFCTDFTQLMPGDNRNFDLRMEFKSILDSRPIRATSVFNGAFTYVLNHDIPLLDTRTKTIADYEGKADWRIDFTSIADTAAFTASAALDDDAPRLLRIAGFQVSPNELVALSGRVFDQPFALKSQGSLPEFAAYIKKVRADQPQGESQLYPQWQQMQYLYSMFAAHHHAVDNDRYPDIDWQTAAGTLEKIKNKKIA